MIEDLDGLRATTTTIDPRFDGVIRPGTDRSTSEALLPVDHPADSHAATLAHTDSGDLLCAWFNGPGEGQAGTNVVLSRLPVGSMQWEPPVRISADPECSEQNPVLFTDPRGTVWLLHTSNRPHDRSTARVLARRSVDHGRSWSPPTVLFDDHRSSGRPGIFLRNPPVFGPDGSWLLPVCRVRSDAEYSCAMISADGGDSWSEHEIPGSRGRVQLAVAAVDGRRMIGLFRSRDADRIYLSTSTDLGRSWSRPERTELPNNNSAIALLRLADGRLVVVFNDATLERDQFRWVDGPDGPGTRRKPLRTPLTLAVSEDGGRSWPVRRNLQNADLEHRDAPLGYSYPALVQDGAGWLHVAYSMLRKTIKYVGFEPSWLTGGQE